MTSLRGERGAQPPLPWVAAALNLILPPVGYVYVGALWTAVGFVILMVLAAAGALYWTIEDPPGLYALPIAGGFAASLGLITLAVHLIAGAHAALIAPHGRTLRSWRLGLAAMGLWLAPILFAVLMRALGPVAIYSLASDSMEPNIHKGDVIAVHGARALCPGANPRPGDVVAYRHESQRWVKRVVATAGQTVQMRGGRLFIDGRPVAVSATDRTFRTHGGPPNAVLQETLPDGASYAIGDSGPDGKLDDTAPIQAPKGFVFVLGDNRDNSVDSRMDGPVAVADLCGVAFKVLQARDPAHVGMRP